MKLLNVSQMVMFSIYASFCISILSLKVNAIYKYKGTKIPKDCIETFEKNHLLHIDKLPAFEDISKIKPAYECALKFSQENFDRGKEISSEIEKKKFYELIQAPLDYVINIINVLYNNNYTHRIKQIDNSLNHEGNVREELMTEYHKLLERYNYNVLKSKKSLNLKIDKNDFDLSTEFPENYRNIWSYYANRFQMESSGGEGPWIVPYHDLLYVSEHTTNNRLINIIAKQHAKAGHMKGYCDNEPVIEALRKLYRQHARKSNFGNIIDQKMRDGLAKSYKKVNDFLHKVERRLGIKQHEEIIPNDDVIEANEVLYGHTFFPHNHVINKLFNLIKKMFKLEIKEYKLPFQKYNDTLKLYEVYDENEKIGRFYVDYFERPGQKLKLTAYTSFLMQRITHLNIIPLIFISLEAKSKEYFSLLEIRELYHEMGHCLQLILADSNNISPVSDTTEFPSMFMEHFAKQTNTIADLFAKDRKLSRRAINHIQIGMKNLHRLFLISKIHGYLIELNMFYWHQEITCDEVIRNVREKIYFTELQDATYSSSIPDFIYEGINYGYLLSEIMAIQAHNHLNSVPTKVEERALEFRKLIFEMKDVDTVAEGFWKFVKRREINIEHFYKFYGIACDKELIDV